MNSNLDRAVLLTELARRVGEVQVLTSRVNVAPSP